MFVFKRWALRATVAVCCASPAVVAIPAVAGAATPAQKWAVVSADGTLVRGNSATSAARISTGDYTVHFSSNMSTCAYEATAGDPATGGVSVPTEVTVGYLSSKARALEIQTWDQATGLRADEPFHLTTYCGTTPDYAVVGGDGTLARGSHVVSSARDQAGQYEVVFDHDVSACSFTATIGTAKKGDVAAPGEISVAGLHGHNHGVFVSTIALGGGNADFPFHLAVSCGGDQLTGVINAGGDTARGTHVVSSGQVFFFGDPNPAGYQVIFDRDVTACSYTATVGLSTSRGFVSVPVTISTASRSANANGVFVFVEDVNGFVQSEPFHLTVTC